MIKKAIIPVGGLGSRLYPLTVDTSKAMIRFLNRPFIEFPIIHLAKQGVREFYFGVSGFNNYADLFDHFGSGEGITVKLKPMNKEVRIRYQPNIPSRGNVEAVLTTMNYYEINEPVIIFQCDNIFSLNLREFWREYISCRGIMAIALKEFNDSNILKRFGVAIIGEYGQILSFVEKPKSINPPSKLVNTGIYILSPTKFRKFFDSEIGIKLYEHGNLDFGRHIIPTLVNFRYKVCSYTMKGYWFDIGTPQAYKEAVFSLLRSLSPEELEVDFVHNNIKMMGKKALSRKYQKIFVERVRKGDVKVEGDVLIGRHAKIEEGVKVYDSVVDHYVILSKNSEITRSIIMDRVFIGENVRISDSIIGRHTTIDDNALIDNSIVGNNVFAGNNSVIRDTKIWPNKFILPKTVLVGAVIT